MKVVVPITNTVSSQSLFDALFAMKWTEGTEIRLVTVTSAWHTSPNVRTEVPALLDELQALATELRRALPHCEVNFNVLEGNPKTEFVQFARDICADLIVVENIQKEGLHDLLVDSVSETLVKHAHCPVFVARENQVTISDIQTGFKTILLPADDSLYADAAIAWLLNFRWHARVRFVITGVIEDESARFVAEQKLVERAQKLSLVTKSRVDVDVRVGDPTQTIVQLVQDYAAELIVIGTHARRGLHKLLLGSVSEVLARTAPCPVAVIRGLVREDSNWHRTGVFRRPKLRHAVQEFAYPRSYSSADSSPHVMPGGM